MEALYFKEFLDIKTGSFYHRFDKVYQHHIYALINITIKKQLNFLIKKLLGIINF